MKKVGWSFLRPAFLDAMTNISTSARRCNGLGEYVKTQVNGTPKECRVRRVDTPAYNADVNGDGVVDIDDVNIVISTMLK